MSISIDSIVEDIHESYNTIGGINHISGHNLPSMESIIKIITDLERVADLATNLGEYTLQAERDLYPDVDIQGIGDAVIEMVEDAMMAYAEQDAEACFGIDERDDEIDTMCERASSTVVRDLIETEIDESSSDIEVEGLMSEVSRLLLTIRDLERVGDHAVNIAARTLYMIENSDELIY